MREHGEWTVRRSACGLWITDPRPADLSAYYPAGYHRRGVADQPFDAPPTRGRFLDLGCGVGDGLALARNVGWEVTGVEFSSSAAEIARSRGFEVIVGDVEVVPYPGSFDWIQCWHVLEHVPDPVRLLRRVGEALAASGTAEIVVPNRLSFNAWLFRNRWMHLDLPRHLHHFRPIDISRLADRAGLEVVRVRHTAKMTGFLGSIDRRLSRVDTLQRAARIAGWALAKARFADVVEYRVAHRAAAGEPQSLARGIGR